MLKRWLLAAALVLTLGLGSPACGGDDEGCPSGTRQVVDPDTGESSIACT